MMLFLFRRKTGGADGGTCLGLCCEVCQSALDYISCPLYITMIVAVKTAITQIVDLIDTD